MKTEKACFEAAAGLASQLLPNDMPEVAFSGKSNVGKSSLINKVLNRKDLARTSSTPGKTATVNFYRVDTVRLVDLPGYGYAKVAQSERWRWAELVEGYFNGNRDLRLVIQLIDIRHAPSAEDIDMLNYLRDMNLPFMVVLTKSDKLNKTQRKNMLQEFENLLSQYPCKAVVPFSALNGEGADLVRSVIDSFIK